MIHMYKKGRLEIEKRHIIALWESCLSVLQSLSVVGNCVKLMSADCLYVYFYTLFLIPTSPKLLLLLVLLSILLNPCIVVLLNG